MGVDIRKNSFHLVQIRSRAIVIGRRVWKYLRIAKQAAAAAMCLIVCPLRMDPER